MTYEENYDVITGQLSNIKATDENGKIKYIPIDPNNKDYKVYLESLNS